MDAQGISRVCREWLYRKPYRKPRHWNHNTGIQEYESCSSAKALGSTQVRKSCAHAAPSALSSWFTLHKRVFEQPQR